MKSLSIIIPVLNEASLIPSCLEKLRTLVDNKAEIIIVDGGSDDDSVSLARAYADKVVESTKGRAIQMNAGAAVAKGQCLLFLHIDTQLPPSVIQHSELIGEQCWGFYCLRLSSRYWAFRIIERLINFRSSLTSVATGDQCIMVGKELFKNIGGYRLIPLMEDVDISKRLRAIKKPIVIKDKVLTSSRRWEQYGIAKTILLMWRLRWAFFRGVDPATFAKRYYPKL